MKRILYLLFFLSITPAFSQGNQPWRSFFSYNNIVDITQTDDRVFAASENAVFSKNLLTNELKTITSVDGLKTDEVSALYHSAAFNKTLVGNQNGLLLVINADNSILNVIDIIEETTIQADKKRINHIYEHEGKAYLSCDFGIAVFDLATLEFGDSYYIGPAGERTEVMQVTVLGNTIYAATKSYGIRSADVTSPNLVDFAEWSEFMSGQWTGVVAHNGVLAACSNNMVYRYNGGTFQSLVFMGAPVSDLRSVGNYLIATADSDIYVFNEAFQVVLRQIGIPNEAIRFSCATIIGEKLFMGTKEKGVFVTQLNNQMMFENITPNGPERSNIFSIEKSPNFLWAVYGGYNYFYTPDYSQYGVSKFSEQGWLNIPYGKLFDAVSLSDIVVNPKNEGQVFIGSMHSGLLKIENDDPVVLYNQLNTGQNGLEALADPNPNYKSVRINGLTYDKTGNLWMTNNFLKKPLKVLKADGQWQSFSFEEVTANPLQDNYGKMAIDKNGTKWIPSMNSGIIAFNEGLNNKFITLTQQESNLPSNYVRAVAIDNNNQLWIGTDRGLRVMSGVDRFLTDSQLTTNAIIIIDDNLAQELMFEQFITDIKVDGANNKWLATSGAGAFLVSPDGQQTLFHFTKDNSPLPSNNINDIDIDATTGEVFFATDKGMVSYKGTSTEAAGDLSHVYVFPNPVRPGFEGDVNISGLIDNANIKITDIEGNLVYETTSEGGTVLWDTRAFGKYKVASGVYMIFIAADDGSETKVKKVMIIRGNN